VRTLNENSQPLLWVLPFAGLTLIAIISLVNTILHFLPKSSGYVMMLVASGTICASVSSFITELIKGRCKYVYVSMSIAIFIGAIAFLVSFGFFKSSIVTGQNTAAVSILSELISNLTLTILPGLFVGAIIGGGVGFLPEEQDYIEPEITLDEPPVTLDKIKGYEKACRRCGALMPFDSLFCSQCGGTLKKRRSENMKYCRYCGKRLHFLGEFCPECGKEINIISKPKVFVSN
jgi:RNA polymerase subunit RPABC4/transcription elongation factor Spt4